MKGLCWRTGREALVADSAQDFAASVVRILGISRFEMRLWERRHKLALVRTKFDCNQWPYRREQLYRNLLNG